MCQALVAATRNRAVENTTKIPATLKLPFWRGTYSVNKMNKIPSNLNIR